MTVGDVLRVEADFFVDGITITSVLPAKGARREPERLEMIGSGRDEPLVSSSVTARGRDDRGDRGDRGDGSRRERRPRREGSERRPREDAGERKQADRRRPDDKGERRETKRRSRPAPPPMPAVERPKAKRLRPGRVHRKALLEQLPEEQRPVVEQLFAGGVPAVRQAIAKQNEERSQQGEAPISGHELVELAERLWPRARSADWRDRADAALAAIDEIDLRDLRSVVSQADGAARDEESRQLAGQLREALTTRVEREHQIWLEELGATLDVGRVVRALRVSSRPPKAGAPLPTPLATRLAEATSAALTSDAPPERWVAVLDALALSPVRDRVVPSSLPVTLHDDVRTTIARVANRVPKVAHIFAIEADPTIPRPKPERRRPKGTKRAVRPVPHRTAQSAGISPAAESQAEPVAQPESESQAEPWPSPQRVAGGAGGPARERVAGGVIARAAGSRCPVKQRLTAH